MAELLEQGARQPSTTAAESMTATAGTANLRTKILDVRGFDSSRILILRGGILMSKHNLFPGHFEPTNFCAGIILVGRLGVLARARSVAYGQAPNHGAHPCKVRARMTE